MPLSNLSRISITLPEELLAQVELARSFFGVSRSEFVRSILLSHLITPTPTVAAVQQAPEASLAAVDGVGENRVSYSAPRSQPKRKVLSQGEEEEKSIRKHADGMTEAMMLVVRQIKPDITPEEVEESERNLHSFYTVTEKILRRHARETGGEYNPEIAREELVSSLPATP